MIKRSSPLHSAEAAFRRLAFYYGALVSLLHYLKNNIRMACENLGNVIMKRKIYDKLLQWKNEKDFMIECVI